MVFYKGDGMDQPGVMRYGDINQDGTIDLLITVQNKTRGDSFGTTYIFYNTGLAQCQSTSKCKQFRIQGDELSIISNQDTKYTFFYDLADFGSLSLVQVVNEIGADGQRHSKIRTYFNYMNRGDKYYLKAQAMNGYWQKTDGAQYYGTTV